MTPCDDDDDDDDDYQCVSMDTLESPHFQPPSRIPGSCMYMCYHRGTLEGSVGANMHLTF